MCGIAGVFRFEAPPDDAPLARALDALAHRGPDDVWTVRLADGAMGTRRLSIVDREGGRQPLRSGQVWVAMNGEIFNHAALRKELTALGVAFRTEADTEVAAALIDRLGVDRALRRLDGQFAIAAYHLGDRRLTLVRDRLGQKPLYWCRRGASLRFASELKGLLVWPDQPRDLDPTALRQLLLFEYIPAPRTIYQGIRKLEAGTLLEVDADGVQERRWWTPPLPGAAPDGLSSGRWPQAIRNSLQVAVKHRVETDLQVAWLLSGGVDSSAVAAIGRRWVEGPPRTFSVVFDEPSFDESGPAAQMAEALEAQHTALRFGPEQLYGALDALQAGLCEPLADGSFPSTWLLCRAVRDEGLKLALSGDGADEHFGGYPTYLAHRAAPLAAPLAGPLGRLARRLPASTANLSRGYLARRFSEGLGLPWARRNQVWLGAFLPEEVDALLGGPDEAVWSEVDRWAQAAAGLRDPAARAMALDQRLYLGEGVLAKVDRASMLCSVEVRSPFLDHRLVELAAAAPVRLHLRGRRTKSLLRDAVADLLPEALRERPKKGFGTPLGPWLQGPCRGIIEDLPNELDGLVPAAPVRRLVDAHVQGERDHRRRLWTLVVLARWRRGPWGPG
ncbi:MAG: asparagine synthase (glutamine-hydrolyzing) [Alphaproteobacteria bacterium]|nr:asparagine synthase (glutamine-hydrolyzing) [Alphaproteobacteria bacterium]